MTTQQWTERFYETTRGRIIRLVRRSERTVGELAEGLGLTDNAVRGHLAVLERDRWIERAGVRRGLGKPAQLYRLTGEATQAFSRAYAPVLRTLLAVLADRLDGEELGEILTEVGERAAAGVVVGRDGADFEARLEAAVGVIEALGGDVEVKRNGGPVWIEGYGCPLSRLADQHEKACRVVHALLEDIMDRPVREACERGEPAKCVFAVERARRAS